MRTIATILALGLLTACGTYSPSQKQALQSTQAYLDQEVAAGHMSKAQADMYMSQLKAQYDSQNDANAMAGYAALGAMQTGYRSTYATFTGR